MQIQFDPFASTVAAIALIVSIWAIVVTKREPMRQRTRSHRDEVRGALVRARTVLDSLISTLDDGGPTPPIGEEVPSAITTLREVGPRLAEHERIYLISVTLDNLLYRWRSVLKAEAEIETDRERVEKWRASERVPGDEGMWERALKRRQEDVDRSTRSRDGKRSQLRQDLASVKKSVDTYVQRLDASDRAQKDI